MWEFLKKTVEFLDEIRPILEIGAFTLGIIPLLFALRKKSYEIMVGHRLDSLDKIRADMAQLLYVFSVEGIAEYKSQNKNIQAYNADIQALVCSLHMEIKPFYVQEIELWKTIKGMENEAGEYFLNPTIKNRVELCRKHTKLREEYDIYDWALWKYDQKLHTWWISKTWLFNWCYKSVAKQKEKAEKMAAKKAAANK